MSPKKILLVDDVELFLELEKTFFQRKGFVLLVARTGKQAYDMTLKERPDLIFTDLYMPEMNGDECCRKIKDNPLVAHIPVVIVTQGGREADQKRCERAACDAVLLKPISRGKFLETARQFLDVSERTDKRVTARLRITYGAGDEKSLSDYSLNLSTGGLFLVTDAPLPAETPLSLQFILPSSGQEINCKGRVAWVNHPKQIKNPQLPPGMGIQFIDLSLDSMRELREHISKASLQPAW